jgi:putative glutamine amidotransferase
LTALRSEETGSKYHILTDQYAQAVVAAGGLPVVLPANPKLIGDARRLCNGFLLVGGGDFLSSLWGAPLHASVTETNPLRDAFEIELARQVLGSRKPLLGICRGHQAMNLALGGSLVQDIPSQMGGALDHNRKDLPDEIVHDVTLQRGSLLARIVKKRALGVNSSHHQAINKLGAGFAVTARSPDGVVEAIELPGHPFAIGVQWHPERLFQSHKAHRQLFQAFATACLRR